MNEQIQHLAIQAGLCVDLNGSAYPRAMTAEGSAAAYQRFAQLLVRECVKVMYDNAVERKVPPDINQTPTHYAVAILEHFGVTE